MKKMMSEATRASILVKLAMIPGGENGSSARRLSYGKRLSRCLTGKCTVLPEELLTS